MTLERMLNLAYEKDLVDALVLLREHQGMYGTAQELRWESYNGLESNQYLDPYEDDWRSRRDDLLSKYL